MAPPSCLALHVTGKLAVRAQKFRAILADCTLCPRRCGVNRLHGEIGKCRSTAEVVISSAGPHFGEEPELVGLGGSGAIFFTNCNLWCLFCQNYEISHLKMGQPVSIDQYHPAFKAHRRPELARRITSPEYQRTIRLARAFGLHRGFEDENPDMTQQQFYLSWQAQRARCF